MRQQTRRIKSRCEDCEHLVMDENWGELKCKLRQHRIYNINEHRTCKDFKKNNSKN